MAAGDPTTNATDYGYRNPIPGAPLKVDTRDDDGLPDTTSTRTVAGTVPDSVVVAVGVQNLAAAPFHDAVVSPTEISHFDLNPAYEPSVNVPGQSMGFPAPTEHEPYGGVDTDNPVGDQDGRDEELDPHDHAAQIPGAPTGVTAEAGAAGHATVAWEAVVDADGFDITGYTVTATSETDGATTPVTKEVAGDVLTADVSGLTTAADYTFTVHATNIAGDGPESDATAAVTIA